MIDDDGSARVRALARRYGLDALREDELLELHLARLGHRQARAMAKALMTRFGGLVAVLAADRIALERHVGPEAALDLKIVRETAVRLAAGVLPKRLLLSSNVQVAAYLKTLMAGLPREEFWVLFLDRKNQLLRAERLGVGTVDHAPVYPREVLRRALELNASAMILAHNHPSGDPQPSRPDIEMTTTLIDAGKILQITVHDHMIVGGAEVSSLRSMGLI
ncbi:RadC family protein [Caulobacter soli]|uniref:RadC family protein n=1 Tax=Caulobacter soli TaxID=2708539 RepID=UPI001FE7767A|nr:DNA repair protein RadC [Caulobacter soli]